MNWEALTAIGTISSTVAALGIAVFSYLRSNIREKKSREKEAIEKILTPIRKDLNSFSLSKWDNWGFRNWWHRLEDMRLDFPLQFFWLNKNIRKTLKDFDQEFEKFDNLREQTQAPQIITEIIADSVSNFFTENNISITGNAGRLPNKDTILNSHWSCSVGGKTGGAVTLYSLVMWQTKLSEYLNERKQDNETANTQIDYVHYSMGDLTFSPTLDDAEFSDKLLVQIENDLSRHNEKEKINNYRKKWQELYNNGSALIKKIDDWLANEDGGSNPLERKINGAYSFLRAGFILLVIFGGAYFISKTLTPSEYTIRLQRECDGVECKKIKLVDSERKSSIENEIKTLMSTLERFDFFTRFTFLRFKFQITNKSQFLFVVTEPKYEKGVDILMLCNLNGKDYVFSPNSGIIFQQKVSIQEIIENLGTIQDILIACNPAPQSITNIVDQPVQVAPNAQVQFIYNEEKYDLRFLPDKWNYWLTTLQMFFLTGILLAAYYELKKFTIRGL